MAKSQTETPKALDLDNNINLLTNSLITSDSTTLLASRDSFGVQLQGRVAGVMIEKNKAKLQEEQVGESTDKRLGFIAGDSDSVRKREVAELKQSIQARAQDISANRKIQPTITDSLTRVITGLVTDDAGQPLRGVHVQVKGTSIGVLTNEDGGYRLMTPVKEGNILFRYLGYNTQEINMKDFKVLNVEMQSDFIFDTEVMVSDFSPQVKEKDNEKINLQARPIYGQKVFNAHIKENLIYPEAAAANNVRGRVLVEFTVKENGDLTDFKILKGLGYGCDEEAIRLIKIGPRWQPRTTGKDEAFPVESRVKVRIRFKP